MKIAGLVKNSFVDYPGQIAAVVFTQGCNYDCFFCHNRLLIPFEGELMDEDEVFAFLEKRARLLDGLVITGGEPVMHPDLKEFIVKAKALGYLIKLDTNGSRPQALKELIGEGLLDYIAMDYKAPFERYSEICGVKCDIGALRESMSIIMESGLDYEFRLTFIPQLQTDDIETMLREIAPVGTFALQHFKMPSNFKNEHRFLLNCADHIEEDFEKAAKIAEKYSKKVILR